MRLLRRKDAVPVRTLEERLEAFDRRRTSPELFPEGIVVKGFARQALEQSEDLDIARATRVAIGVVLSWRDGVCPDGVGHQRLDALGRIMARLDRLGLEPEARAEWLRSPNRAFGDEAVLDLIGRDEQQRVLQYVERLS
jgi:Antitoxin Xre/MbcA/ParS C-terminal toxin-binding domain